MQRYQAMRSVLAQMALVALLACSSGSCRNGEFAEPSSRSARVRASAGSSNHFAHADTGASEAVAPAGSSLARGGLGSPDPAVRADALRALASARPSVEPSSLHQIVALLGDEARYEKTTRVDGYGRKDGGAYQSGRVVTVQEPVGDLAAMILVKMGPQVVDLVSGALTSSNAKVRERAACVLARIGSAGTVRGLAALTTDESYQTKSCAVHALAQARGTWALQPLIDVIKSAADATLRRRAIQSLTRVVDVPAESDPRGEALMPSLRDPDAHVAASAALALGQLHIQAATPQIISMLEKGEPWQRSVAAKALGALGDRRAIPALRRARRDPDEAVRADATHGLEELQSGRASSGFEPLDLLPDI